MKKDITVQELKKDIYEKVNSVTFRRSIIEFKNLHVTGRNYRLEKDKLKNFHGRRVEMRFTNCLFDNSFSFINTDDNSFDLYLRNCILKRNFSYDAYNKKSNAVCLKNITVEGGIGISGPTKIILSKVTADTISFSSINSKRDLDYIELGEMKMRELKVHGFDQPKGFCINKCHESLVNIIGPLFPSARIESIFAEKGSLFGSSW